MNENDNIDRSGDSFAPNGFNDDRRGAAGGSTYIYDDRGSAPQAQAFPPAAAPAPGREGRRAIYTAVGAAVVAVAALVAVLFVGLSGGAATSAHSKSPVKPGHTTIRPIVVPVPVSGGNGTGAPSGNGTTSPSGTSSPRPSAYLKLVQQQLAQLNYYMGPINGFDSPQLHQSIEYLQRDAHLPRTGTLNTATQSALSKMFAQGNNQMAG